MNNEKYNIAVNLSKLYDERKRLDTYYNVMPQSAKRERVKKQYDYIHKEIKKLEYTLR
tara:strand:- start:674 stop:847 length:174 start_codon:yes stop_codon:yes gene_type:complete